MRKLVSTWNRAGRRRWQRRAARLLASGVLVGGALTSQPASALWSPGGGVGTFSTLDLSVGVPIDIDGDTQIDLTLNMVSGYGGSTIYLTPSVVDEVNDLNNEVFSSSFEFVRPFALADDVLTAVANEDETIPAPVDVLLWDITHPAFQLGAVAGVLFEIPGGSPYVGYLDLEVSLTEFGELDGLVINETGFQPIPEPGTATLLLGTGLLGLALRRRARPI